NYLDQGTNIDRVEPGERLVKNEDLGLSCHGGDKLDLLLITFRQFLDLVVFDVEHVQALQPMERTRPRLVMTHTFQLHEVLYDILNFLPRVESALFWQIANASLVLFLEATSKDLNMARIRTKNVHDQAQQRRLSGTVGAKESKDFSALDFKGNTFHRNHGTEGLSHRRQCDGNGRRRHRNQIN